MTAANSKTRSRSETRLLAAATLEHALFRDLPNFLRKGDLLVVNDAATMPASFFGAHRASGHPIEMRLVAKSANWLAAFFGEGTWRTPTESRLLPPRLQAGDILDFKYGLSARVVKTRSKRLAEIEFLGTSEELWRKIYLAGRPIQYSYLKEDLELWDVQTIFSGPPVALEPPSASFPMTWEMIFSLEKNGIRTTSLTHAAGISSIGDDEIDKALPFPERYWIPEETAQSVNHTRSNGGRVVAVGTTVVRALESAAAAHGTVRSGAGIATLKIYPAFERKVVSGIISGFHDEGASHLELLGSFLEPRRLAGAYREAEERGYLAHEFGDSCLILSTS